ncbi:ComF family protein [Nesterenkonia sp. K-15-9-6]|uniref:ComF family protein n=1 Tax=Nesterenkonia sp. K-15-9-6 TaxID=3093918 RepID=UPI0040446155
MGAHRSSRPTGWTSSLRRAARELAGVLSPVWCAGCGREDTVLCRDCAQLLAERTSSPFRAEDQALALPLVPSSAAEDDGMGVLPVVAAASYDGVVARAILAFKDHEVVGLSRLLAPALRAAVETVGEPQRARDGEGHPGWDAGLQGRVQQAGPLLVTPPPTPASLLRRSHRPVDHLLRAVGLRPTGGLVTVTPSAALRSLLPGGRQKTRGSVARRRALRGTLRVTAAGRRRLPGARVLLVDDVLTTGATLHELHRVLREVGADVSGAAVVAAARRDRSAGGGPARKPSESSGFPRDEWSDSS